jgi:hypothetical protein
VNDSVREGLIDEISKSLLTLGDEQLKRENTESLHSLIHGLEHAYQWHSTASNSPQNGSVFVFQSFWLTHTLKVINSGSLVLKLFGYDQLQELIRDAYQTRPVAHSYLVKGAGNPNANGLYEFKSQLDDHVTYEKAVFHPDEPLLTLFRCTMRTKSKWWFISQADKDKPGTDKDIDYYQHKSTSEEDREPQSHGWNCMGPNNPLSKAPAPTLERVGEIIPEGLDSKECLINKLPKWCTDNDLLNLIFSQSMHREIILRSTKLIMFLSSVNELTSAHIKMIWKAAMTSHDNDIVDEILLLLVQVSSRLNDDLYKDLIDLAHEAVKDTTTYSKVSLFTEKFGYDSLSFALQSMSENSAGQLLSLVWGIYSNNSFESLKNCGAVQDLLSRCFELKGCGGIALLRVKECVSTLHAYNLKSDSDDNYDRNSSDNLKIVEMNRSTSGLNNTIEINRINSGISGVFDEERSISRVIHTLQFLISRHLNQEAIHELNGNNFSLILIEEIKRFFYKNQNKDLLSLSLSLSSLPINSAVSTSTNISQSKREWYASQLSERLQVIRLFFGVSQTIKMPLDRYIYV